jgi:hypothetical protein
MRVVRAIALACLLVAVPACASNNKGKIVGKWQITGGTAIPGAMPAEVISVVEFTADGKFNWTASGPGGTQTITAGNYSLGWGDNVSLSNLNPAVPQASGGTATRASEKVTITGDQMKMTDPDGKYLTMKKI